MNFQEEAWGRSLDVIYERGVIHGIVEDYRCSVCDKEYKTLRGAEKHVAKRTCHTAQQLFKDTAFEHRMLMLHNQLPLIPNSRKDMVRYNGKNNMAFLRSRTYYKQLARFTIMVMNEFRNVYNQTYYASRVRYMFRKQIASGKFDSMNQFLAAAMSTEAFDRFREFLYQHQGEIDSKYASDNLEALMRDDQFLIEALERADVGLNFAARRLHLDARINRMTSTQQYRLERFCEKLEFLTEL